MFFIEYIGRLVIKNVYNLCMAEDSILSNSMDTCSFVLNVRSVYKRLVDTN